MIIPELVKEVADKTGRTQNEIRVIVDLIFDEMKNGLINDGKVLISRFGTFTVADIPEKKIYNVRTGKYENVPERKNVRFKLSPKLKNELNNDIEEPES